MTSFELLTLVLSGLALLISLGAVFLSGRANDINIKTFKRQGVIDLHMAWQDIKEIDRNNLIGPDIVRAVNAMSLTASLWNHDVIEKSILYQSYWTPYRDLYDTLNSIDELVPGFKKTCRSLMTDEITKDYEGMKKATMSTVLQYKI